MAMRACHGEGAEVSPLGANDYFAFGNVWVGMNVFPLKVFVRGQMSTSNKPAKIGGIIELIWGLLLVLAGNTVRLEDGPQLTDPYGRNLAYAYTVNGASNDETLIAEGSATAWTRDGQHRDYLVLEPLYQLLFEQ